MVPLCLSLSTWQRKITGCVFMYCGWRICFKQRLLLSVHLDSSKRIQVSVSFDFLGTTALRIKIAPRKQTVMCTLTLQLTHTVFICLLLNFMSGFLIFFSWNTCCIFPPSYNSALQLQMFNNGKIPDLLSWPDISWMDYFILTRGKVIFPTSLSVWALCKSHCLSVELFLFLSLHFSPPCLLLSKIDFSTWRYAPLVYSFIV